MTKEFVPVNDVIDMIQDWDGVRLNWDEYFISIAYLTASRSSCKRLNVGCVIVDNNRIVATGYNGHIAGAPHTSIVRDEHEQATIHAEQNAIADAAKRGIGLNGTTAYVTHFPCITCFKLMVQSGIHVIKYMTDYKNDPLIQSLIQSSGVKLIKIEVPN